MIYSPGILFGKAWHPMEPEDELRVWGIALKTVENLPENEDLYSLVMSNIRGSKERLWPAPRKLVQF